MTKMLEENNQNVDALCERQSNEKITVSFEKEEELLRQSLEEQGDIIKAIKNEIDAAKVLSNSNRNRNTSSPFTYLYNMYANLITAQNSKNDTIKTLISTKKLKEELQLKLGKQFDNDDDFQSIANIIISKITNNFSPEEHNAVVSGASFNNSKILNHEEENDDDGELDRLSKEAAAELDYKTENQLEEKEKKYVCTTEGVILEVDDDMNVLKEISDEDDEYKDFRVVYHKKTGKLISAVYLPKHSKLEIVEYE